MIPTAPRVVVIVVTFRSVAELPSCVQALAAQENVALELVMVDNASGDGTVALARELAPWATIVENPSNVGYGRANNQVLLASESPWFAIVNPDAVLPPNALATALAALMADRSLGIVGLRHFGADGRPQASAFPFLDLVNLTGEMFALDRFLPGLPALSARRPPGFDPSRPSRVDWVQGSFMVVRGDAVRAIGGFDPDIFMYGEDLEWCWRMRQAGFGVLYLPEPAVRHLGGASGRDRAPALFVEHLRSRLHFFARHRGRIATAIARTVITAGVTVRWLAAEALGLFATALPNGSAHARRRDLFRAAMRWAWSPVPGRLR